MKTVFALVALAGLASAAQAQVTYNDTTGDAIGFDHIDISSVVVSHDASNIYFSVNNVGSVVSTNWGKYMIAINTGAANADAGNGWNRPITFGGQLINFWVGSWADNGGGGFGGELRQMDGAGNNSLIAATYAGPGISGLSSGNTQSFTVSRALLGLTGDQTFSFDVMTSGGGGGDGGVDHLSTSANVNGFGASESGTFLSYTIPAPTTAGLLGLAGVVAGRRRRA